MAKRNNKNFTEEQAVAVCLRQKCKCAVCGKKAAHITEEREIVWTADIHHRKPKSRLTSREIDSLGTAGGVNNGILVCRYPCHENIHGNPNKYPQYMLSSWQEILPPPWEI